MQAGGVIAMQDAEDPSFPVDAVEVGWIAGAWGVKGWFKVEPFSADPQALFSSRRWFLKPAESALPAPAAAAAAASSRSAPDHAGHRPVLPALLRITQAREHGGGVIASARDIEDRGAAQALRGARVFVSRASFPTAGDDEYYWIDLIGLSVVNRTGETLGRVTGLLETGAHCVLRVQAEGVAERLIPFVAAYVDEVDLPGRSIRVDWGADY
jgi:16S rRNA processing protein RimM